MPDFVPPDSNCALCPRLVDFRAENTQKFPDKHNAPVPSFGDLDAELLVVGLAPGLKGANFSGRPFTGDYAGDLLYATLLKFGFATGTYGAHADDGLALVNCRITNAVRCVPPENKPTGQEENQCRPFLQSEIAAMPNLKVILSLGLVSHKAVLKTCGQKISAFKFAHGAVHKIELHSLRPGCAEAKLQIRPGEKQGSGEAPKDSRFRGKDSLTLIDSYHCSRYNTQTGRLTTKMFEGVFKTIKTTL